MAALMDTYSNDEFEDIVKNSCSYKDCLYKLGYSSNSGDSTNRLKKKIKDLNINTSHFIIQDKCVKRDDSNVFIENSTCDQKTLRKFFLKKDVPYVCSICGLLPIWNDKPLTLILDHINGKNHDDRLKNLRWVCPNCNMQLETTNARNPSNKKHEDNFCVDCGKLIDHRSTRCMDCYKKNRLQEK